MTLEAEVERLRRLLVNNMICPDCESAIVMRNRWSGDCKCKEASQ